MTTRVEAELPTELVILAQQFVGEGWMKNLDELLAEALRRYLESHASELTEEFLRADVQWGLHGRSLCRLMPLRNLMSQHRET